MHRYAQVPRKNCLLSSTQPVTSVKICALFRVASVTALASRTQQLSMPVLATLLPRQVPVCRSSSLHLLWLSSSRKLPKPLPVCWPGFPVQAMTPCCSHRPSLTVSACGPDKPKRLVRWVVSTPSEDANSGRRHDRLDGDCRLCSSALACPPAVEVASLSRSESYPAAGTGTGRF